MAPTQHRHYRCDDAPWEKAQKRATKEGTTFSARLREFTYAYAAGYPMPNWTPVEKGE